MHMNVITRRTALKLGLAGSASLLAAGQAAALVKITVSGGNFKPLPIAIPDFASSDPQFGGQIADIVRNDLKRSGLFELIDQTTLPVQVGDVGATPDFASYRNLNADAVVMGQVERGGQIQASVRVWDTQAGQQIVGKSYTTSPQGWRRIGHIVADAVYEALTGEGGYFDSRIVYVSETGPRANRTKRLAIMDQDGANVRYLTSGKWLTVTPRFSPSDQMLTYMDYQTGEPQVYVLDLATGKQERIGSFGQMTFASRFSPDGRHIVFSVESNGVTNLYMLDVTNKRPVRLTDSSAIDTAPCFSPDGKQIAFESDRGGSQQIYIMSAAGGGAQRISYGDGSYSTPVWSPKGDLIAFTKRSKGQFQIGTMKSDGSGERILVSTFHAEGPTWSPNGQVIMYFSDPGGNDGPHLYTIDIYGRNQQQLKTETYASDPAWSPLRS